LWRPCRQRPSQAPISREIVRQKIVRQFDVEIGHCCLRPLAGHDPGGRFFPAARSTPENLCRVLPKSLYLGQFTSSFVGALRFSGVPGFQSHLRSQGRASGSLEVSCAATLHRVAMPTGSLERGCRPAALFRRQLAVSCHRTLASARHTGSPPRFAATMSTMLPDRTARKSLRPGSPPQEPTPVVARFPLGAPPRRVRPSPHPPTPLRNA
jgi:hypothetical protein